MTLGTFTKVLTQILPQAVTAEQSLPGGVYVPMQDNLLLIISLLFAVSLLSMLAQKLGIAYPIFLVIAGLFISFIPGVPLVRLEPELVFLVFLPPLLYGAAWNTSWRDFWQNRRAIMMMAFGLVIFTSAAIAFVSQSLIPGFTLAMGFLLGGIVSPPDAVAATSVLQGLKVPKRIVTLLEGESLINDASSLIVFRFALVAITTGQFVLWKATTQFALVVVMGVAVGLAIAFIVYLVHRFLPTTPSIDAGLTLLTPYLMYISAEHFHFSGVLAVVSGGLFLSFRSHEIFAYNSRIQAYSLWDTVIFLLNGMVFILIGLQLPDVIYGLGQYSIGQAIFYALVITGVTIGVRILWMFPGAYLPRLLSRRIRRREQRPPWQSVLLVAWSGMRGVVSLAAAFTMPYTLANGEPLAYRNLILFITFVVILITLVGQGLTLPWLIRVLKIEPDKENPEEEAAVRLRLANAALNHIQSNYAPELTANKAYVRVKERYERMIEIAQKKLLGPEEELASEDFLPKYRNMLLEVLKVRREELHQMHLEKFCSDDLLRNKEWELDLEEARLNEGMAEGRQD
jgi:Na+/H+ antiporter